MGKLFPVQTYLSAQEIKSLDKIARSKLRSRSDTTRLIIEAGIKSYIEKNTKS